MVTGLALVLHQSVGSGVVQQCVAQKLQVMMQLLARAKGGGGGRGGGSKERECKGTWVLALKEGCIAPFRFHIIGSQSLNAKAGHAIRQQ